MKIFIITFLAVSFGLPGLWAYERPDEIFEEKGVLVPGKVVPRDPDEAARLSKSMLEKQELANKRREYVLKEEADRKNAELQEEREKEYEKENFYRDICSSFSDAGILGDGIGLLAGAYSGNSAWVSSLFSIGQRLFFGKKDFSELPPEEQDRYLRNEYYKKLIESGNLNNVLPGFQGL